jgi:hypothetical protein
VSSAVGGKIEPLRACETVDKVEDGGGGAGGTESEAVEDETEPVGFRAASRSEATEDADSEISGRSGLCRPSSPSSSSSFSFPFSFAEPLAENAATLPSISNEETACRSAVNSGASGSSPLAVDEGPEAVVGRAAEDGRGREEGEVLDGRGEVIPEETENHRNCDITVKAQSI